jgi:hypothetical protein
MTVRGRWLVGLERTATATATASATGDPCGMTNRRASNGDSKRRREGGLVVGGFAFVGLLHEGAGFVDGSLGVVVGLDG